LPYYERATAKRRRRFDDDDPSFLKRFGHDDLAETDTYDPDAPETGDRWSTWDQSSPLQRGPRPYPDWLVTELAAVDTELGILKTGKEADVYLIDRGIPDTDRRCLLAAKRYRASEHKLFHRDAGYLEGRRVRESRNNRAMAKRTAVGREMISMQWANAEFGILSRLAEVARETGRIVVPYPVQIIGTEVLMEFIGDHQNATAAPRLAQVRPEEESLQDLWEQVLEAMVLMARLGYAHGDLSPYNILVHDNRIVIIDLPQVVDVIANPHGAEFLERDARNVATWFRNRGVAADAEAAITAMKSDAGLR
jgi:RIO kinase 1